MRSVARVTLETRAAEDEVGTVMEIAGGNMLRVEDAGLPAGTTIAVRDLFFNTPARRKFLRAEQTELGHMAALVTHYALAHPEKHFELHSATQALLMAPAVANAGERLYPDLWARDVREPDLRWRRRLTSRGRGCRSLRRGSGEEDYEPPEPGFLRMSGFVSKPELQKLNRNSIYVFVNQPAGARPAGAACADGGVPQHHSADVVSGGAAVSGDAAAGGGCECASGEDGGAVPAGQRLCMTLCATRCGRR